MDMKIMASGEKSLVILDDDKNFRKSLVLEFQDLGYQIFEAENVFMVRQALEQSCRFDFGILDLRVGQDLGLHLIPDLLQTNPLCRIVMLTGYPTIATTVGAIKAGAVNYLLKPCSTELIEQALWMEGVHQNFDFDATDVLTPKLNQYEFELIEFVLIQCDWNVTKAAKRLGLHRQSLQRKMRKYPPLAKRADPF